MNTLALSFILRLLALVAVCLPVYALPINHTKRQFACNDLGNTDGNIAILSIPCNKFHPPRGMDVHFAKRGSMFCTDAASQKEYNDAFNLAFNDAYPYVVESCLKASAATA